MKSYKVLSQLNHDNRPYQLGDEIGLNERMAKPLLDCGVIESLPEIEPDETDPETETGGQAEGDPSGDAETNGTDTEIADVKTETVEAPAAKPKKAKK